MRVRSDTGQRTQRPLRPQRIHVKETLCELCGLCVRAGVAGARAAGRADARPVDWPQFRGTPRLSGVATAAPPATLALKWTYDAGESVESSAAIADGAVYVGSTKGELLALDLETGKLRWKYATGANGFIGESSPAVHDGAVFVGDLAGTVHAVSTTDGKKLWTFTTDGEVKSSPAIVDDLVLIGSYDTHLYALERQTGKLRWKLQTDGPVHATPAVQNGIVYIAGCDERFRAVRAADGKVLFEIPLGAVHRRVDGDRRRPRVCRDLRRRRVRARPEDTEGRVALPRSRSAVPVLLVAGASTRAPAGTRVIVGGRDKAIHAIDAATGKAAWKFVTRARVDSSPGARRRARLRRIERRQALRARRGDRREAMGVRRRRRDHRLPRGRRRPRRRRRAGRADLLFRVGFILVLVT